MIKSLNIYNDKRSKNILQDVRKGDTDNLIKVDVEARRECGHKKIGHIEWSDSPDLSAFDFFFESMLKGRCIQKTHRFKTFDQTYRDVV